MTASIPAVRNAELPTLLDVLNDRQARKIDLVVPGSQLRFEDGELVISGLDPILEEDGLTDPNGTYQVTGTFEGQLADRLHIHPSYLRRLRNGHEGTKETAPVDVPRLDLYDANVNGLLGGRKAKLGYPSGAEIQALCDANPDLDTENPPEGWHPEVSSRLNGEVVWKKILRQPVPADPRSHLVRLFRSDETGRGLARGIFSNRYFRMEDLDGLMAMMQGIQEAGIDPSTLQIHGDLTETRMYVHVSAPEIGVWAPELLGDYRSPFDTGIEGTKRQARGYSMEERARLGRIYRERGAAGIADLHRAGETVQGHDGGHGMFAPGSEPIIHAGFVLMNSELGNGRWQAMPEFTVLKCTNGWKQTSEIFARTHLGSKMDDGHIQWSADTQSKELAWVAAQTKDLVKLALSQEYIEGKVAEITQKAGTHVAEESAVRVLEQKLKFSKEDREGIMRHFLMGGQATAGGLMQAVTSFSQTLDADDAWDMDLKAMSALEFAASRR